MVVNKLCVRHNQHYVHVLMVKHVYSFQEKKATVFFSTKILGCFIWGCARWVHFSFQSAKRIVLAFYRSVLLVLHGILKDIFSNEVGNLNMNFAKNFNTFFLTQYQLNYIKLFFKKSWFISLALSKLILNHFIGNSCYYCRLSVYSSVRLINNFIESKNSKPANNLG